MQRDSSRSPALNLRRADRPRLPNVRVAGAATSKPMAIRSSAAGAELVVAHACTDVSHTRLALATTAAVSSRRSPTMPATAPGDAVTWRVGPSIASTRGQSIEAPAGLGLFEIYRRTGRGGSSPPPSCGSLPAFRCQSSMAIMLLGSDSPRGGGLRERPDRRVGPRVSRAVTVSPRRPHLLTGAPVYRDRPVSEAPD
jgi:hypothetical protein